MTVKNLSFWILVKPEKAHNPGPDFLRGNRRLKPRSHRPLRGEPSFFLTTVLTAPYHPTPVLQNILTHLPGFKGTGFLTLALSS